MTQPSILAESIGICISFVGSFVDGWFCKKNPVLLRHGLVKPRLYIKGGPANVFKCFTLERFEVALVCPFSCFRALDRTPICLTRMGLVVKPLNM